MTREERFHLRREEMLTALREVADAYRSALEGLELTAEARRVFDVILSAGLDLKAKNLAALLGLPPTSLMTRFRRQGLPSPRQILVSYRLACGAAILRLGYRVGETAEVCGVSSSQAFIRTMRNELGVTSRDLRHWPTEKIIERTVATLYESPDRWRGFRPLSGSARRYRDVHPARA